ncbi:MAG: hypothetical protein Q9182_002213 [Xanthomendoza sp. 2 TL-2023]
MNMTLLLRVAGFCLLQATINAVVVGFVPSSSVFRLALLPVVVWGVFEVLPICLEATGTVLWGAFAGSFSISSLFQYIDTALLSRWSADGQGPTHIAKGGTYDNTSKKQRQPVMTSAPSKWQRLKFGYQISVSTRKVGTPYQVKGISPFSTEDPSYLPPRGTFLLIKAIILLCCYLVLDLSNLASQPEQNQTLYHPTRISWANPDNFATKQLLVRTATALGFWLNLHCIIQLYMGVFAFSMVGIGVSRVEYWPPSFSSIADAYSVRRFWG